MASHDKKPINLTHGEKLIVALLCDIHRHLKVKGEMDPDLIMSAITGGNLWALGWRHDGLLNNSETPRNVVSEVVDFLDMWRFLEDARAKLKPKERARIKESGVRFASVEFLGFDGNNELDHMSAARFLIDDLERFTHFKGRELNSHIQVVGSYRSMYRIFEGLRPTLADRELTADEIISVLKGA